MSAVDTGLRRYDKLCGERIAKMPDLLLRDVPELMIDALERQAALHGRTVQAEHRVILEAALRTGFWERAAALREATRGGISIGSEEFVRQDRDER